MEMQGETETWGGSGTVDRLDAEPVSERVIEAVADAVDAGVADLQPLYEVIDPDALNNIFGPTTRGPRTGGRIVFAMAGCEVVVDEHGAVEVTPMDDAEESRDGRETGAGAE